MKRLIILLLAAVLLSAQTPSAQPAYYAINSFKPGATLAYKTWTPLTASYFTDIRDGVVTLSGSEFLPTAGVSLIQISGTCMLKRNPGLWVMAVTVNGEPYYVIDTDGTIETINITVPAGTIIVSAYQEAVGGTNAIKCQLLFDAVY
jgi:hypothetical protein